MADRQDSRSHSSRRSSPDSERQARSRAGSYDSRERERDRDPYERERKDLRPQQQQQPQHQQQQPLQQQQPPLLLQQPLQQQRDWEPEPRDWPSRGREPLLLRPGLREPPHLRERDMRERERLLPEGLLLQQQHERERDRERERMLMMELPPHGDPRAPGRGDLRGEPRADRSDYEPLLPREAFSPPEGDKPGNSHHPADEQRETERVDSVDGAAFFILYHEKRLRKTAAAFLKKIFFPPLRRR